MIENKISISHKIVKLKITKIYTPEKIHNRKSLKRILEEVKVISKKKFKKKNKEKNQNTAKNFCRILDLKSSKKKLKQSDGQNIAVLKINGIEKLKHGKKRSSIFIKNIREQKNPNLVFLDIFNFSTESKNNLVFN